MSASAFAPGKLILVGEHAVVYGHPALAVAVDRGTTVHLRHADGPTRITFPFDRDPRLDAALAVALPAKGFRVEIASDLPIGRGMGSSAALAVALACARCEIEGDPDATLDSIDATAMAVERVFHGDPSGIDHTVSMLGGAIRFRRGVDGPEYAAVDIPQLPLVVIDSGSSGDTAALVASVKAQRPECDPTLTQIGDLVQDFLAALPAGNLHEMGRLMTENHRLLCTLGVSTPTLDAIVALALDAGAVGAKLAGAGGGGVVVALAPDSERVLQAAAKAGYRAFTVRVLHRQ
jgi:mevalonate kinase